MTWGRMMRPIRALSTIAGAAIALLAPFATLAADDPMGDAAAKIAVQVCSNCHGPGGHSTSPIFPRLAGQQELYLAAQIKAFRSKERGDPEAHDYMWGMATLLDDPMVAGLSKYFAAQAPSPGTPGDPALVEKGRQLYEQGDPKSEVIACKGCHGPKAAGNAIFPRLAGQHAEYIARQLEVIQRQLRASPIMHGVVKNLDAGQIQAVAQFLQAQ
jgi:cytochrome c553